MINRLINLLGVMMFISSSAIAQINIEQYFCIAHKEIASPMSIFNYESRRALYVEGRVNYESMNTFSIYAGKSISKNGKTTYSVTPMLGVLMGKLKGGSLGLNVNVEYNKKIYFSTQSQYTLSHDEGRADFFYAWSELAYQPQKWIFLGLSSQHTYMSRTKSWVLEPGCVLGFNFGNWTVPIYGFSTGSDGWYFVAGISFQKEVFKRKR